MWPYSLILIALGFAMGLILDWFLSLLDSKRAPTDQYFSIKSCTGCRVAGGEHRKYCGDKRYTAVPQPTQKPWVCFTIPWVL